MIENIITQILNRLVNCLGKNRIYKLGNDDLKTTIFASVQIIRIDTIEHAGEDGILWISHFDSLKKKEEEWIAKHKETIYGLMTVKRGKVTTNYEIGLLKVKTINDLDFILIGCLFCPLKVNTIIGYNDFRMLAIVHIYNEEDVIEQTIRYLLGEGLDLYLLDNWSTDNTFKIICKMKELFPDRIQYEQFPPTGKRDVYLWYEQLERTEQIADNTNYDWYIHYDADEMRISPWENLSLRDTFFYIDKMGFNIVDHTVIEFKITENSDRNIFMENTWFEFGRRAGHFQQLKAWKKSSTLDLKSSGGHIAIIEHPKPFPLKILNRHYPLRSVMQAHRKIFMDRLPRFGLERKIRGWHTHYDQLSDGGNIISPTDGLIFWNQNTISEYYMEFFMGIGICWNTNEKINISLLHIEEGKTIAIYGAGNYGQRIYEAIAEKNPVLAWVDKKYKFFPRMFGTEISAPEVLFCCKVDYVIIAIKDKMVAEEIQQWMKTHEISGNYVWNPNIV